MKTCPQCGQPLAEASAEGLCARCLMSAAVRPGEKTITDGPEIGEVASPEQVNILFPHLEILELVGRGGMGAVYRARQRALDRIVALKVLPPGLGADPQFAERFLREARALAKLNHPNIVTVHDFGESGGRYYLVMEFIDGANLRQMLKAGQLQPKDALAIVPKICEALQYAHDEGVVHRDIKPENVLVDRTGRVKIADFGLAKLLGKDSAELPLTQAGMHLGTPRYMAPEQLDKPETVDHRADIYSLGVVFYEMLTGEVPMGRFALPSEKVQVDVKLDEIVLRSLERDVERRYQHVSEVKQDVESVSAAGPMSAKSSAAGHGLAWPVATAEDPHLSRAALCGAIWALFGVIAIIPAVFFTTLDPHARQASGPPPLAFTLLMSTLFFIGAGAPIGTTILGWVALGHIKRSRGTLYGLPLAFADAIFFPMLLLHGAMAVLLGLLLVTLMKMAGVNTGLGSAEMGLVAMLPLIADFFIVRALWRKLAGKREPRVTETSPEPGGSRHLLSSCLVLLFFAAFIFAVNFRATSSVSAAGRTSSVTVGTFDPLFVRESGPAGFHQSLQVISWSFFALVVAGVTFGALWRIGREDAGKVARDSIWWRGWWKQVGFWCGLLLIGCIVRTVKDPQAVMKYANAPAPPQPWTKPAKTENNVTYLESHTSAVKAVAVSPDGRTLVSAGMDGRVLIRDLPDGKVRRIAVNSSHPKAAPSEQFRSAVILADSEHALIGGSGGKNGLMKVDLFQNQLERFLVPNEFGAMFTQLLPCDFGAKLAYIAGGTELHIYDMNAKRLVAQPKIFPGKFFSNVHAAAVSPDGAFIAVPSSNMEPMAGGGAQSAEPCRLTVFDMQGVERLSWQFADYADFSYAQVAFTDTRTLVACLPSGKMQRWMLDDEHKWQPDAKTVRISPGRYTASAVSRDGKIIWLAENQQIVGIDSATGKGVAFTDLKIEEKKENYSGFAIEQIAVTNDPMTIAAALWDGRVALAKCWPLDVETRQAEPPPPTKR